MIEAIAKEIWRWTLEWKANYGLYGEREREEQ